jgi:undecaprenyl-diphosphatase
MARDGSDRPQGAHVTLVTLLRADDALVGALNSRARRSPLAASAVGRVAAWLAGVEVLLMLALALAGRRDSALRMFAAVGLVYLLSDALGAIWPRQRPFARLVEVEALATHSPERSFPSRHVASALAMAAVGGRAHPRLGTAMASVGWVLGVSRVTAGLHYPSDVIGGALLGAGIGWFSQPVGPTRRRLP